MRIIFLDIDGVLNSQLYMEVIHKNHDSILAQTKAEIKNQINTQAIIFLNYLCEKTDAKVVISSSWRHGHTLDELRSMFKDCGFTGEIVGATPFVKGDCIVRGNEILQWICDNEELLEQADYFFKSYVIFDDDTDMLLSQKDHFIHVDSYIGLTPNNCEQAKKILEKREW